MKTMLLSVLLFWICAVQISAETNTPKEKKSCFVCSIPHNLIVSNQTPTSVTLNWSATDGATLYTVEVQDFLVSPSVFFLSTTVSGNTLQVNGLQASMTYKFKVRANCGGEDSFWSEWRIFTPLTANGGNVPVDTTGACNAPIFLSSMTDGAATRLSWNNAGGAIQYYVQIEDEQGAPAGLHMEMTQSDSSYLMTGLQAGMLYKFKVGSHCSNGVSGWSNWQFFNGGSDSSNVNGTTGGPPDCNKPIGLQATAITANSAVLSWFPAFGVSTYSIEVELFQPGLSSWQFTRVVTTSTYTLSGLSADTRYKFKVRANCAGGGNSHWSNWRKFKTTIVSTGTPGNNNPINPLGDRGGSPSTSAPAFDFSVWPNPVQSSATLRLQILSAEPAMIQVFNLAGRPVISHRLQPENSALEVTLSLSDLPDGMYLLQIQNGAQRCTTKLAVQH